MFRNYRKSPHEISAKHFLYETFQKKYKNCKTGHKFSITELLAPLESFRTFLQNLSRQKTADTKD